MSLVLLPYVHFEIFTDVPTMAWHCHWHCHWTVGTSESARRRYGVYIGDWPEKVKELCVDPCYSLPRELKHSRIQIGAISTN